MLKQLQPYLGILNQVLVDEILHEILPQGDSVRLETTVQRIQVRATNGEGTALEGLTIEDLQVGVQDLVLPLGGSKDLALTFRLDHVTLRIAPAFWARAAEILRKRIIAPLGRLLDTVSIDGFSVRLMLDADKIVGVEVKMKSFVVESNGSTDIRVENLRFLLRGFDLKEKDKKKAISLSQVTLDRVEVYVTEGFLNRTIETFREKIPAVVTSLGFSLEGDRMIVTAKTKLFPMAIPTELTFSAERNLFGIYIVKVLVGFARPLILKAVQWFAANRPEIEASDSRLYINPWAKIPVPVNCKLSRFAVEDRCVVVAFSPVEPPEEPLEVQEDESEEAESELAPLALLPIP